MSQIEKLIKDLYQKIEKNDLGSCLQDLITFLKPTKLKSERKILINASRRLKANKDDRHNDVINLSQFRREENKIAKIILDFIDKLETEDFSEENLIKASIYEKILVISYDEDAMKKMKTYFSKHYFVNVFYDFSRRLLESEDLEGFDLLIFDYMHHKNDPTYYNLLEDYLERREIDMLYFGRERLKIIEEEAYNFKTYSANSVFALYPRLWEMIDFKKYYSPTIK